MLYANYYTASSLIPTKYVLLNGIGFCAACNVQWTCLQSAPLFIPWFLNSLNELRWDLLSTARCTVPFWQCWTYKNSQSIQIKNGTEVVDVMRYVCFHFQGEEISSEVKLMYISKYLYKSLLRVVPKTIDLYLMIHVVITPPLYPTVGWIDVFQLCNKIQFKQQFSSTLYLY